MPRSSALASRAVSMARLTPRNLASGRYIVESDLTRVGNRAHCKDTLSSSTVTSTELPGLIIHDPTISGVLLASHRLKISGSFR
jgi:hypothetical protein